MSVDWMAMDESLNPEPIFYVEKPDGIKNWSEINRQVELFKIMRMAAPKVFGFAIPNAGKRNPMKARKENILGGVFDTEWQWEGGSCHVELKGYTKAGVAGKLSHGQIEFGNRMTNLGKPVACFFTPMRAVEWMRELGAPIATIR